MADRDGSGVAASDEAELLARVVRATRLLESASTKELIQVLADQPLAERPVWHDGRVPGRHRIFMGLVREAPPLVLSETTIAPSWGSLARAVYVGAASPDWFPRDGFVLRNVGGLLNADLEDGGWLELEPIREDLRNAKSALVDIVEGHQRGDTDAVKRAEAYVVPLWHEVVSAPPHPETGQAQVWIGGVQAACAHAGMLVLKKAERRARLRTCPRCGRLLFTLPQARGPIREACPGHGPGDTARDERKHLREALQAAGCPRDREVARVVWKRCPTITELRDAAWRDETWLHEEIHAALVAQRRTRGLPAPGLDAERLAAGVVRRLRTPPFRHRPNSVCPPWGSTALDELGLGADPFPTEDQVQAAYETMVQRLGATVNGVPRYLVEAYEDALVSVRSHRNKA